MGEQTAPRLLPLLFAIDYAAGCPYEAQQLGPILAQAPLKLDPPRPCALALLNQSPQLQAEAVTHMAAMGRADMPRVDMFLLWVQLADDDTTTVDYDNVTTTVYECLKAAAVEATDGAAGRGSCVLPLPHDTMTALNSQAVNLWSSIDTSSIEDARDE